MKPEKRLAVRELREEAGLKAVSSTFLFEHKVFLVATEGAAGPRHEIRFVDSYGAYNLTVRQTTKAIIDRYRRSKALLQIGPMRRIISIGY